MVSFELFVIHAYMYGCFVEMQCKSSSCGVGSRSAYPDFYFYAVCSITVIVHIRDAFIRWLCHYLFVPAPV